MSRTFEFYADSAKASGERAGLVPVERATLDGRRVVELYDAQWWAERRRREAEQAAERAEESRRQRRLRACLADWHASFEAVPGLLERI